MFRQGGVGENHLMTSQSRKVWKIRWDFWKDRRQEASLARWGKMFKTAVAWQKSSVSWDGAKEEYKTKGRY